MKRLSSSSSWCPEGKLTPQLYTLREGDVLSFRRVAKGRFTFDVHSGHTHHLLVCTVTGIAPFVSFVRTLYKNWKDGTMPAGHCLHVLNGASTSSEFGYRAEMERYQSEVPWLKYVPTISRPWAEPKWAGEQGRVQDILRKYTDQWNLPPSQTTAYLCGHPQMVRNSRDILIRRGLEEGSIREEIYFLPANDPSR